jgi:DNA-binding beta-propeller fold protein YncE
MEPIVAEYMLLSRSWMEQMSIKEPAGMSAEPARRRSRGLPLLCAALVTLMAFAAQADLGLQRVITLPGVRGQFGQLALDAAQQRLFVVVTGSNSLLAIDLQKDVISERVTGLNSPLGVAYLPSDQVAVSASGNGAIGFYTAATFNRRASLIFGSDAGALYFDPGSKKLYLGYGRARHAGIAVLDVTGTPLTQLATPDQPQALVVDPLRQRLYAGFSSANAIRVFDLATGKRIADWSLGEGSGSSYPLALDGDGKRLFIGGRSGDEIGVLDTQSGNLLQTIAGPGDTVSFSFDPQNRELYVPGGTGQLALYKEDADGVLHALGRILTRHGAHSGVLDADSGRYYLAVPATPDKPAEIRVYLITDQATD